MGRDRTLTYSAVATEYRSIVGQKFKNDPELSRYGFRVEGLLGEGLVLGHPAPVLRDLVLPGKYEKKERLVGSVGCNFGEVAISSTPDSLCYGEVETYSGWAGRTLRAIEIKSGERHGLNLIQGLFYLAAADGGEQYRQVDAKTVDYFLVYAGRRDEGRVYMDEGTLETYKYWFEIMCVAVGGLLGLSNIWGKNSQELVKHFMETYVVLINQGEYFVNNI